MPSNSCETRQTLCNGSVHFDKCPHQVKPFIVDIKQLMGEGQIKFLSIIVSEHKSQSEVYDWSTGIAPFPDLSMCSSISRSVFVHRSVSSFISVYGSRSVPRSVSVYRSVPTCYICTQIVQLLSSSISVPVYRSISTAVQICICINICIQLGIDVTQLYICIQICTYICIRYVSSSIQICIQLCIDFTQLYICSCIQICTQICTYLQICIQIRSQNCMQLCIDLYLLVYMYIDIGMYLALQRYVSSSVQILPSSIFVPVYRSISSSLMRHSLIVQNQIPLCLSANREHLHLLLKVNYDHQCNYFTLLGHISPLGHPQI